MADYDPNTPRDPRSSMMNNPMMRNRSTMGIIGALVAVAIIVVLGLLFWNTGTDTTAESTSPPATTGAAPSSPASPPAKSPATPASPQK